MPGPSSSTVTVAHGPSARADTSTDVRAYLRSVLDEVGEHLREPVGVGA